MSREVEGYYNEDNQPVVDSITLKDNPLSAIFEAIRSHDGWVCPHCGHRTSVYREEMSNQRYMELLHEYAPLDMYCNKCDKIYYLKCAMTVKYYTCVDESFSRRTREMAVEEKFEEFKRDVKAYIDASERDIKRFEEFRNDVREYVVKNEDSFKLLTDAYERNWEAIELLNKKITLISDALTIAVMDFKGVNGGIQ